MVIVINHCSSNLYGNRDMKVKLIFRNNVPVTIDAEVEHTTDGLVLRVIENPINTNGVKLGYNYSSSKSKHRRKSIPEETLLEIGKLLKRGLTNRQIADKLNVRIESVNQVRIVRCSRYQVIFDKLGGW